MHEYYTSKTTKKQAYLAIFTIFVNYADFYVNIIMSTAATIPSINLPKTILSPYIAQASVTKTLNIDYAGFLSFSLHEVNLVYPPSVFVQLNQFSILPSQGSDRVFV